MKGFIVRFARNRGGVFGVVVLLLVVVAACIAPVLAPEGPLRMVALPQVWPGADQRYPLGTDALGRNLLAGMLHGAGTTLIIGLAASAAATVIGITVGLLAGFFGGWVDPALMRLTEIFQTIPGIILLLAIVAVFGTELPLVIVGIAVVSWTPVARLVRAEVLSIRGRDYIVAARSVGMRPWRIMVGEILPNALPPVVVLSSLIVASAILFESALSFLGLSDPNVASWGRIIGDGRAYLRSAWYIAAIPGAAIFLTVLALNLVGDALNDALNPRLRDT